MSGRRLVYIAGPFAGQGLLATDRKAQEAINVNRACFVGHVLWRHRNYAPIVPHAIGTMVYGDDHDEEVRQRSIESGEVMAQATARAGGSIFALRRDDGTISEGTSAELRAFGESYDARNLLGLEPVEIDWFRLLASIWGVHVGDDPLRSHHIVWVGTFARFLDLYTVRGDWELWQAAHGSLGPLGDR